MQKGPERNKRLNALLYTYGLTEFKLKTTANNHRKKSGRNQLGAHEAQCLGTPVLGANIGGIPETINVSQSGLLFEPRNKEDLKEKIVQMFQTSFDYEQISKEAQERFSADNYYNEIIKIYEQ